MTSSTTFRIKKEHKTKIETLVDVKAITLSSLINEFLVEWYSKESKRLSIEAPDLYVKYLTKIGDLDLVEEYKKSTLYKKYIGED